MHSRNKMVLPESFYLDEAINIASKILKMGKEVDLINLTEGYCAENGLVLFCQIRTDATFQEIDDYEDRQERIMAAHAASGKFGK